MNNFGNVKIHFVKIEFNLKRYCSVGYLSHSVIVLDNVSEKKKEKDGGNAGIEPATSRTLSANHTTRLIALHIKIAGWVAKLYFIKF